jgi:hypothetical protein
MPIFRINNQLHYFVHIPKCGGASIETYLIERFGGPLGLWDMRREELPRTHIWMRTSPQHISATVLDQLVPRDWMMSSFAVVRHPLRRLISAFAFSRDVVGRIPLSTEFNAWFEDAATWIGKEPYRNGGHLEPQGTFIPRDTTIFRLEDGLDAIIPYLDGLAGNSDGPRQVPFRNVGRWRGNEDMIRMTPRTIELVNQVYAQDFARFGYVPVTDPEDLTTLPDLPSLPETGAPPVAKPRSAKSRILRYLHAKAGL